VADAEKVRPARYNFIRPNASSQVYVVTQGYAVLDGFAMPIIAENTRKEPNDVFRDHLIMNAEAAINYIDSIGIGDKNRVGVGGHSYGAFMTANLLAHTKLFKAGIARSGAYNRSLTPNGFQSEPRTYWKAPQLYFEMSPFSYANQIKTPILLVHGQMDNNQGTFPIQTERLYHALTGLGGHVRYIQLPNESHGYAAKESQFHVMYETLTFLDKYVKNAKKPEQ
jgi:dipeptidyl aminopeptidase/acylaminoacyl peptidase